MNQKNRKESLVNEQRELKERVVKLTDFINSSDFYKLSPNNRQLLRNQKIAMELYLNVLNMRVFEDVDKITVPDLALLQTIGSIFTNSPLGFKSEGLKALEEELAKEEVGK